MHLLHVLYFYYLLLSKLPERHVFHKSVRSLIPKKRFDKYVILTHQNFLTHHRPTYPARQRFLALSSR